MGRAAYGCARHGEEVLLSQQGWNTLLADGDTIRRGLSSEMNVGLDDALAAVQLSRAPCPPAAPTCAQKQRHSPLSRPYAASASPSPWCMRRKIDSVCFKRGFAYKRQQIAIAGSRFPARRVQTELFPRQPIPPQRRSFSSIQFGELIPFVLVHLFQPCISLVDDGIEVNGSLRFATRALQPRLSATTTTTSPP